MEAREKRPGQGGRRHDLKRALEAGSVKLGLWGLEDSPLQKGRSHWLPLLEADKVALVTVLDHLVIQTWR